MKFKKNTLVGLFAPFFIFGVATLLIFWTEVHLSKNPISEKVIVYDARKGMGDEDIAKELQEKGIIRNNLFFRFYVIAFGYHGKLQAGKYEVSSSMSIRDIVKKIVEGDTIKNKITIIEGWNLKDIAEYLESKNFSREEFLASASDDWSQEFVFLKDKPKSLSLEGYVFPDTYETFDGQKPEGLLAGALSNFGKKLTPDLENEISRQKKSIFQIITMASIIEKEVKTVEDKKIVSGILWKRLKSGVPLQVDATINYITGKHDSSATIGDTKIDSPYNTYKYPGLPKGPISNPGLDSILAAIYPQNSPYWYYLSANLPARGLPVRNTQTGAQADGNGQTIFSKTLDEHNEARAKYLKP